MATIANQGQTISGEALYSAERMQQPTTDQSGDQQFLKATAAKVDPAFQTEAQHILHQSDEQRQMRQQADYIRRISEQLGVNQFEPKQQLQNNVFSQLQNGTADKPSQFRQPASDDHRSALFQKGALQEQAKNLAPHHSISGEQLEDYINQLPVKAIEQLGKNGWSGQKHKGEFYVGIEQKTAEENLSNIILANKRKYSMYAFV